MTRRGNRRQGGALRRPPADGPPRSRPAATGIAAQRATKNYASGPFGRPKRRRPAASLPCNQKEGREKGGGMGETCGTNRAPHGIGSPTGGTFAGNRGSGEQSKSSPGPSTRRRRATRARPSARAPRRRGRGGTRGPRSGTASPGSDRGPEPLPNLACVSKRPPETCPPRRRPARRAPMPRALSSLAHSAAFSYVVREPSSRTKSGSFTPSRPKKSPMTAA